MSDINRQDRALIRMRDAETAIPDPNAGLGRVEWFKLARVGVAALVSIAETLDQMRRDQDWERLNGR
jgi:hypothetical protein